MEQRWDAVDNIAATVDGYRFVILGALGLGVIRYWSLSLDLAERASASGLIQHDVSNLASVATLIILISLPRIVRAPNFRWVAIYGALALTILGVVMHQGALGHDSNALLIAGNICSGSGYAALLLYWLELLGCVSPARMVLTYGCSHFVTALTWKILDISTISFLNVMYCLPLLSVLSLFLCYASPEVKDRREYANNNHRSSSSNSLLAKVIFWTASFSFASGMFSVDGFSAPAAWASIFTSIPIILGIIVLKDEFDYTRLCRILLSTIAVLLFIALILEKSIEEAAIMIRAALEIVLTLGLTIICHDGYRYEYSVNHSAGLTLAGGLLAAELGKATNHLLLGTFPARMNVTILIIALCMFTCGLTTYMVFSRRDENEIILFPRTRSWLRKKRRGAEKYCLGGANAHQPFSPSDESTSETHPEGQPATGGSNPLDALSPRETEVAEYLIRNCSTKEIADVLFISDSTVRAHISRIKVKMHIDRDEPRETLIALLQKAHGDGWLAGAGQGESDQADQ